VTHSNKLRGHELIAKAAIEGGAHAIQFRAKKESAKEALEIGRRIKAMCKRKALFFVNDRFDLALALDADGLHLGQEDMPIEVVKELLKESGKELIIGLSTHNLKQALDGAEKGPHYLSFGPIFPSRTKPSSKPLGIEKLREVCKKVSVPVIAIGGINSDNAGKVIKAGAWGVAAISAISQAKDAKKATQELLSKIGAASKETL
jgi:thiamine-phosphate pyrophosphorylase